MRRTPSAVLTLVALRVAACGSTTARRQPVAAPASGSTPTAGPATDPTTGQTPAAPAVATAPAGSEPRDPATGDAAAVTIDGVSYLHADEAGNGWQEGVNGYDLTLAARTAGRPTAGSSANKVWAIPGLGRVLDSTQP
jgi:hypothetical protein